MKLTPLIVHVRAHDDAILKDRCRKIQLFSANLESSRNRVTCVESFDAETVIPR